MKPSFALDFRDGAIALLHRTSRGWQQVGATPIDAPDLGEALAYLRSTALGLSPRGLATKLVLPNDQVLYTSVHAPGPEAAKRRKQIRAALEGLTPYRVDELVFDWWGTGPEVQVAVVAKETLAEAEAFAAEHRLNPVSFVAAPDNGLYLGEPFFGPSALSASLLTEGEKVERDQEPISVVARDYPRAEAAAAAAPAVAATAPEPEPAPAPESEPALAPEPVSVFEPEPAAEPVAEAPARKPEAVAEAAPEVVASPQSEPEAPAPAVAEPPAPSAAPVKPAEPDPLPDFSAARAPAAGVAAFDPAALAVDLVDEAPMALDVPASPVPEAPAAEEPPAPVARIVDPAVADPLDDLPATPAPSILSAFSSRRGADKAEAPPAKGAAAATDFARAAAEAKARKAPALGPAPTQRATVPRPSLARPAAGPAAPSRTETLPFPGRGSAASRILPGKGKPSATPVAAPTAKRNVVPLAKPGAGDDTAAATSAKAGTKGLGGIGGRAETVRGKPRYLGLILTGLLLLALAAVAAWSSYFLSANDTAPTGEAATPAVAQADPATSGEALPSAEDEALADGQDLGAADLAAAAPETTAEPAPAEGAATAAPAAEAAAEPAPETGLETAAATPVRPGNDPLDEIFLASSDTAPGTSDAVLLPAPVAGSDPPPELAAPPPPFGTVYAFDEAGRIKPTPEGIITPEGVLLVEGAPQTVPPSRPAALTQPSAAPEATALAETAPAADAAAAAQDQAATEPLASETFQADPALADKRPRNRPEGLAPAATPDDQQGQVAAPVADSRLAGFRPQRRPEELTEAPATDLAALGSLAAGGLESEATALGVAVSRKPMARPSGMDQAVDAAVAAALQTSEPAPEAQAETQTASTAPEEQEEPEVDGPAPDIPTSASVARQATQKDALNLNKLALIGIFGTSSNRYAMIRQTGGGIKRVKVGDTIDGGRVASISATELVYQKGGRMVTLTLPRG